MTLAQDALDTVSHLDTAVEYSKLLPLLKALDRLQQLERQQENLLNREVIARELFIGDTHGSVRDELTRAWKSYLRIEAEGFPKKAFDPREKLARYRAEADVIVNVLRSAIAYN